MPMEILFVASELAPMVKVGGLADVVAALSKALRLLGHKVTIALPRYPGVEAGGLMLARRLTPITFGPPGHRTEMTVYDGRLGSGVELLLLDAAGPDGNALFDRPGVYGEDGVDYPDNDRRFGLFCQGVAEFVRSRAEAGAPFDIVHAHDWPAALVPYLLRERAADLPKTRTVLTLHNLAHQGVFPREALAHAGLGPEHFAVDRLEFYGKVNYLKGGILAADQLTAVSTTYAREILTPELGDRLDGVLRLRESDLVGITNGIDYSVYNPMTDPALAARYDADDQGNKGRCKAALLQELGLEIRPERPLLVSVGRVVAQKGSDLLAAALPKILKADVAVAIAGTGDLSLAAKLEAAVAKSPERAAYLGAVPEAVVHRLLAAADAVVIPSRYEPCGLVQLYAQRYGAIPVACRTGGLSDTIVDCDAALETGSGFLFDKPTATALVGGVQRALAAMTSPRWAALRRRVMRLDLGWDRPARRYASVYRAAIEAARPRPSRRTAPPRPAKFLPSAAGSAIMGHPCGLGLPRAAPRRGAPMNTAPNHPLLPFRAFRASFTAFAAVLAASLALFAGCGLSTGGIPYPTPASPARRRRSATTRTPAPPTRAAPKASAPSRRWPTARRRPSSSRPATARSSTARAASRPSPTTTPTSPPTPTPASPIRARWGCPSRTWTRTTRTPARWRGRPAPARAARAWSSAPPPASAPTRVPAPPPCATPSAGPAPTPTSPTAPRRPAWSPWPATAT